MFLRPSSIILTRKKIVIKAKSEIVVTLSQDSNTRIKFDLFDSNSTGKLVSIHRNLSGNRTPRSVTFLKLKRRKLLLETTE